MGQIVRNNIEQGNEPALLKDIELIEHAPDKVVALARSYPAGYQVKTHIHTRSQFLYVRCGVVLVTTKRGRWMIPRGHALFIPQQLEHMVDMFSNVEMLSVYILPTADQQDRLPCVLEVNELTRSLIAEAVRLRLSDGDDERTRLIFELLSYEINALPERDLGLPFPVKPALAALCRDFLLQPDPAVTIDCWAGKLRISRRSFTRLFRAETGVSFVTWRQQACIFASLPKLAAGVPITTIAFDAGYESSAAFSTMFKRMLGSSPRDYMKQQENS